MDIVLRRAIFFLYTILVVVTPLLMFHKTSELFEFNKLIFIYISTILISCFWFARMVVHKKVLFTQTVLTKPLLFFLATQVISAILSIDRHTSLFGYYGRFNGGLFSIISYVLLYNAFVSNIVSFSKDEAIALCKKIITFSLITASITILWALPGRFGYDLTCLLFTGALNNGCWSLQFNPAVRTFSTLGQPNWYGAYLAITFFMFLYYFLKQTTIKYKRLYGIGLSLNFCALLFTRSRSAFLAVAVGLGLFLWKTSSRKQSLKILLPLLIIPILIFKTGVGSIDKYLKLPQMDNKQVERETKAPGSVITESFDIRRIVWKGAIEVGRRYPLFGSGVETFAYSYYFVRPVEHNLTSEWDFIYNKAHNEYLNYFATTGSLGISAYLILILSFLYYIKKELIKQKENDNRLVFSLLISYITILITNFFGFSTTVISLYFYLIPAVVVTFLLPESFFAHNPKKDSNTSLDQRQKVYLITLIFIGVSGLAYVASYFMADITYARAEENQMIQDYEKAHAYYLNALAFKKEHVYADKLAQTIAGNVFLASGSEASSEALLSAVSLSRRYSQEALDGSPLNSIYWKNRAKNSFLFYQALGEEDFFTDAVRDLANAKKIAPTDPKGYYTEALFYSAKLDGSASATEKNESSARSIENLNEAIRLKPNYRDAYYLKGLVLKKQKKLPEAKAAFEYIVTHINPQDEEAKLELESF